MTIGIYMLIFPSDKFYIGKSDDIHRRILQHLNSLKRNRSSTLLQKAYNEEGPPELLILEECSLENLNAKEVEYIGISTPSINSLNLTTGGDGASSGINNINSKYSKEEIIKAFNLIITIPFISQKEIAKISGVGVGMIEGISAGLNHKWLKEDFPTKYHILECLIGKRKTGGKCAKDRGIIYPPIMDTEGNIYTVEHNSKFAEEHKLDKAALHRVLTHKAKSHLGWKLA